MKFEELLELDPYALDKDEKKRILLERLVELTEKHRQMCKPYAAFLDSCGYELLNMKTYKDVPFIPVRVFKELEFKSVDDEEVVKIMTSSGTSGQRVSKIYLDKNTSMNQQRTMVKIVNDFTGSSRMPMIIIDCPSVLKDRKMFSARGAGILGFSIFGSKKIYALSDDMKLDVDGLKEFLEKYKGQKILLFGFTFMIWQFFYKELSRMKEEGITFDLSNGIMIHGGGWKKLISESVSQEEFHNRLHDVCGLDAIHDYYGMVEQTGCIYMQCEYGHFHASNFSDVIIRNPFDFSECAIGEKGIIQVVSTIPESYPGHSLLTEDEGVILGEDDCPCGRRGKYFKIFGRLSKAEIRGCSDTFAVDHAALLQNTVAEESDDITFSKLDFLVGDSDVLRKITEAKVMLPFDDMVVEFCDSLSKVLLTDCEARNFADIVSLGFWLRKASINCIKEKFILQDTRVRVGRGVAFHIAPSNVPVNYAYSLFSGLLCGNANVVRVPSKDFPQIAIINKAINRMLDQYPQIKAYICLVRYERDSDINVLLSSLCDVRVVWGGNATISELRKAPLKARATEVTFADRYSLAVIDSDAYISSDNKERIASDFYNDTFLTDQNACTSPRVVVWMGNKVEEAKSIFWKKLRGLASQKYQFQPIMGIDKFTQFCLAASSTVGKMQMVDYVDNRLVRVKVEKLLPELMDYKGNCGFFYEYDCGDILELHDFCNDSRCQTIGVVGAKEMIMPLVLSGIKGIDRIVNIGHTMDFDFIWDGYNLMERLTRTVSV